MLCRSVIGLRPACARPAQSGRALSSWLGPALLPQARPNGRAQASRALSSWLAGSAGDASGITMHGTTILCVRKEGKVAMIGDGQVSLGNIVMKPNAKKVRRIGDDIIVGFAGSTADAFTLLERLERKLEEHPGQLTRACVDLAKAWRTDKYLRRLEAVLLVADKKVSFELTGNGDVLEPKDGIMGIGSGGAYALAAARALADVPGMDAETVAKKAMDVASDLCVFTNKEFIIETLDEEEAQLEEGGTKPSSE